MSLASWHVIGKPAYYNTVSLAAAFRSIATESSRSKQIASASVLNDLRICCVLLIVSQIRRQAAPYPSASRSCTFLSSEPGTAHGAKDQLMVAAVSRLGISFAP